MPPAVAQMPAVNVAESDMSDEHIQNLLEQAAARMRQKKVSEVAFQEEEEKQRFNFPRLETGDIDKAALVVSSKNGPAQFNQSARISEKDRRLSNQVRKVEDPVAVQRRDTEKKKATAGERWFNLPKTEMTPEFKRDLQLLKMRNVLDPHRHYKKDNGKMKAPEYSQVGKIIEGPTEYYTGRVQNRDRKRTFVEEVLAGESETGRFKKKYGDIQDKKQSGRKAYYNAVKAKRTASYKKR